MNLVGCVMLAAALVVASPLHAQSSEDSEKIAKLEDTFKMLGAAHAEMQSFARKRRTECLKAIGNERFCGCINDNLPIGWSFSDYVAIATRSKEENGYSKLEPRLRASYDNVAGVRNECVASSFAP